MMERPSLYKTSSLSELMALAEAATESSSPSSMESSTMRLVVLDYDDTLSPSSWVAARHREKKSEMTAEEAQLLMEVEKGIGGLLQAVRALGCAVVIITNADREWVEYSCARYLPRCMDLLSKVHVVSARHFEHVYPGRSVCWKAAAFTHVAKAFFATGNSDPRCRREIISIGDSNDERLAVRAAAAPLNATPKAIKLVDSPRLWTVARQLQTVAHCLPFLVYSDHAVDVDVAAVLHLSLSLFPPKHDKDETKDELQLNHHLWQDAAWGVLSAIRFQGSSSKDNRKQQQKTLEPTIAPITQTISRIISDPTIPAAA